MYSHFYKQLTINAENISSNLKNQSLLSVFNTITDSIEMSMGYINNQSLQNKMQFNIKTNNIYLFDNRFFCCFSLTIFDLKFAYHEFTDIFKSINIYGNFGMDITRNTTLIIGTDTLLPPLHRKMGQIISLLYFNSMIVAFPQTAYNEIYEYFRNNFWLGINIKNVGIAFGKREHILLSFFHTLSIFSVYGCFSPKLNDFTTFPDIKQISEYVFLSLSIIDTMGISCKLDELINKFEFNFALMLLGGWINKLSKNNIIYTILNKIRSIFNIIIMANININDISKSKITLTIKILYLEITITYDQNEYFFSISFYKQKIKHQKIHNDYIPNLKIFS